MGIKPIQLEIAKENLLNKIVPKTNNEEITLDKSKERISSDTITSNINLPSTANSAVDGYGFLSESLQKNSNIGFEVIGISKAGHPLNKVIRTNQAVEIYTGAKMPEGIDTIAMHENCIRKDNIVKITSHHFKNQNMRPIGENLKKGELVIKKGKIINSADIGQLAASGNNLLSVYKKLKISLISTGDELIDSSVKKLKDGEIYDANRPMLLSLFDNNYLEIEDQGIVKDKRQDLANKYKECLYDSDVVISSGGASDGIEDHTQNALKDIGANCLVWQLAMKPGKPMAVGMINNKLIFCLPGNPVAAFVCSKLLIKPLINKLAGGADLDLFEVMLPAGFEHKKRIGRAEYLRAKIVNKEYKSEIILHGRKGAGVISSLTGADGLVEIPIDSENVLKGDYLKFYPFNDISL